MCHRVCDSNEPDIAARESFTTKNVLGHKTHARFPQEVPGSHAEYGILITKTTEKDL